MQTQIRGSVYLSHLDADAPFYAEHVFGLETESEESLFGIVTGDLDGGYEHHHAPVNAIAPVWIPGQSPLVQVDYQDHIEKPYPLANAYRVTVVVAYVEKHPDIEAIADEQTRNELYGKAIRAAIAGFSGAN